ncbi:MAG: HNH endonuclease [Candidatus Competibacteraceae bacterium]|nr:MAG: HNH endonuclease [Candidatus Competibacteraceae bacterium]
MPSINIAAIISKMPKHAQKEFLEKQTSSKGKGGNLLGFCSQDNWQAAATRAANAFFAKIGELSPRSVEEQIGYGLIALAGQNPHFKGGRGAWNRDIKALEAAVLAAGNIALSIRNLPSNLCSLLTQPHLEQASTLESIDTEDAQLHQRKLSVELELEQYRSDLETNGYFDPKNEIDARRRIVTSIVQRAGQARFREQLLEAYGNRCAITECDVAFALEAAHILPYKGEYTNDVRNGLLLRADIHTLFDLGKISINPENYCVILADDIWKTSYIQLHGKPIILPKDDRQKPDKEALDIHFKKSAISASR